MRGTHSAVATGELEGVHVKPVDGLPRFPRTIDPPARPFMRVPIFVIARAERETRPSYHTLQEQRT